MNVPGGRTVYWATWQKVERKGRNKAVKQVAEGSRRGQKVDQNTKNSINKGGHRGLPGPENPYNLY